MPCRDVKQLHPTLQCAHAEIVRRGNALGHLIGVNQTYRSIAYQNELYAQGRTTPGPIVTYATGGNSAHNYRLAFDVHRLDPRPAWYTSAMNSITPWVFYNGDKWFDKVAAIWVAMGGKWGGSNDGPHMEFTNNQTISWYKAGNEMPENTLMKWEMLKPLYPEENEMRYKLLTDIPNDWDIYGSPRSVIKILMDAGIIKGNSDGTLDLSHDMVRMIIINYRGGCYDNQLIAAGFAPAVK